MKIRSVRGTHDVFGDDIEKHKLISEIVRFNAKNSGFSELNTPIFESSELFLKPLGEHSDVVLKEMYTFEDRNSDKLTLRPEYTTPMIRASITNNLLNDLPLKIFGIGPMFRRERPQKGRYRQFNQINFEIFGSNDFFADVEIIYIANEILKNIISKTSFSLNINYLGSKENILEYKEILTKYFSDKKSKLSESSLEKINTNPLRILDSKDEADIEISRTAPLIKEIISDKSKHIYNEIKNALSSLDIEFVENNNLVRGLDYYCNTVFEFKTKDLGSQDTLLGGGRYDNLIGTLGGPDISGIGWAAGIERIAMLMDLKIKKEEIIHIAISDEKYKSHLFKIFNYLNKNNISYYWNYKYNLKKSLSRASQLKIKNIIIIGDEEHKRNTFTLKNLYTGLQNNLKINQIKSFLDDQS